MKKMMKAGLVTLAGVFILAVVTGCAEGNGLNSSSKGVLSPSEEKEYYSNEVKPELERAIEDFDDTWKSYWNDTMSGIGDGSVSIPDAIKMLNRIEDNYVELVNNTMLIEGSSLSKENKEKLDTFKKEFNKAVSKRSSAVQTIEEMLVKGKFDSVNAERALMYVEESNTPVLKAVSEKFSIEENLDIE